MSKPHKVQVGVHGKVVNAKSLAEPQVGPAQLLDINLENITEVNEHVAGALRPAGDVHAGSDDVGALPPPGHALGQGQLVEVEGHVHVVLPQPQLLCQGHNLGSGIPQSDLS